MTSRRSRIRNFLLLSPVVTGMLIAAGGCATPRDRCNDYVRAMNTALEACNLPADYNIVDSRDPDRIGCGYVSSIDNPGDIVRCVNLLRSIADNAADNPDECGRLESFPDNLPPYCDVTAFQLVR